MYFGDLRGVHWTNRTSLGENLKFHFLRSFGPFVLCWFCRLDCGELSAEILFDRILVSSPCGDGLHSWDMELREDVSWLPGFTMVQACSSHNNGLRFFEPCSLWTLNVLIICFSYFRACNLKLQSYTSYEMLFTQAVFKSFRPFHPRTGWWMLA